MAVCLLVVTVSHIGFPRSWAISSIEVQSFYRLNSRGGGDIVQIERRWASDVYSSLAGASGITRSDSTPGGSGAI